MVTLNPNIIIPNIPRPEGTLPPLPDPIPEPEPPLPFPPEVLPPRVPLPQAPWLPLRIRSLRGGCYLVRYTPNTSLPILHYDGTMRVERVGTNTTASGDLYLHRSFSPFVPPVAEPSPTRIPVFPRARYRYYLRVTQILEWFTFGNSFTLGFERHRFNQATNSWTNEGVFTALMAWTTPPSGYPSGSDYLSGDVKNSSGSVVGRLTMAWVSPYLRRAVIEVDRVNQSEYPNDNGAGNDWRDIFEQVGWNVTVVESDPNLAEPSGESWSDAELHAQMLQRRDSSDLDSEWRYHLLCVRRLDSTSRGIMYDAYGGDSNNIPREGAAIASHWVIPDTPTWGLVRNMRFGAANGPYFRTAVHELGHALGLYHNTADNGFMNTTGVIANNAPPGTFPSNVQWSFNPDDAKRLRHMPDPWVRPGMIPFGSAYGTAPISPDDMVGEAHGLQLKVAPVLGVVPIGAPVRVDIELANITADQNLSVPTSLSLKSGDVSGKVVDPSGTVRAFWPVMRCIDEHAVCVLGPGQRMAHSLTLLRGPQGALFPSPGTYQVIVDLKWDVGEFSVGVRGSANVMVTSPIDESHSKAALKILSTPDALLTLAIGGDHLSDGIEAIRAGLNNPVLHPHFVIIEAKRVGRRFGKRPADVEAACALIDDEAVLSIAELKHALELVRQPAEEVRKKPTIKKVIKTLKDKVEHVQTDENMENLVKDL